MNILAIDPGTKTGFAAIHDGQTESGVVTFNLKRGESRGMRYVRFNAWLEEILMMVWPDIVVYEMAHQRGGSATEVLLGMTTRIMEACEKRGIDYSSVHSATLKKFATGSGRASKDDMEKAAIAEFKKEIKDDNEADALMMLKWAQAEYDQEKPEPEAL